MSYSDQTNNRIENLQGLLRKEHHVPHSSSIQFKTYLINLRKKIKHNYYKKRKENEEKILQLKREKIRLDTEYNLRVIKHQLFLLDDSTNPLESLFQGLESYFFDFPQST